MSTLAKLEECPNDSYMPVFNNAFSTSKNRALVHRPWWGDWVTVDDVVEEFADGGSLPKTKLSRGNDENFSNSLSKTSKREMKR